MLTLARRLLRVPLIKRLYLPLRDAQSEMRRAAGLPHNRTRAQVRATKARFDPGRVAQLRLELIASASGLAPDQIAAFVAELDAFAAAGDSRAAQWARLSGAAMGLHSCRTLYALVRALRSRLGVETGTSAGASAAHILQAMQSNGGGRLVSVDVPGPFADRYGELIPAELRPNWELRLHSRNSQLPALLAELGSIDFFLHDSLHNYRHMTWEYETAWQRLAPGGCLASHDIHMTSSFEDFLRHHAGQVAASGAISSIGFVVKARS